MAAAQGRISGLDALRGEAALCVMLFHVNLFGGKLPEAKFGFLAVDLFFLLSGYVMARTYEQRMRADLTCWRFMAIRLARLWPLLAVGALLGAVQMALGGTVHTIAVDLLLTLLLLPNLMRTEPFPVNGPTWSVFFELIANAVHGSLLWRLSNRWLGALLIILTLGYLALLPVVGLDTGNLNETLVSCLPRVFVAYLLGISVYRFEVSGYLPVYESSSGLPGLLTAILLFLAIGPELDDRVIAVAILVLFPLLVIQARSAAPASVLVYLGRISFPLYAVHIPVLKTFHEHGLPLWGAVAVAIMLAAALTFLEAALRQKWRHRSSHSAQLRSTGLPAAR